MTTPDRRDSLILTERIAKIVGELFGKTIKRKTSSFLSERVRVTGDNAPLFLGRFTTDLLGQRNAGGDREEVLKSGIISICLETLLVRLEFERTYSRTSNIDGRGKKRRGQFRLFFARAAARVGGKGRWLVCKHA